MNNLNRICSFTLLVAALLAQACSNPIKNKLKGNWRSTDGVTELKITEKEFSLEDGENIPEMYHIKKDTIFTSIQENEPLNRFVVEKLDDHYLKLLDRDSAIVEFCR